MKQQLRIEYVPITALTPNPRNARIHPPAQIEKMKNSIAAFDFINPLLVDRRNEIIAGHGRLEAAIAFGLKSVPIIRLYHLNRASRRALAIADNKLPMGAQWNPEILAQELEYLSSEEIEFDVELTGFDTAEVDLLVDRQGAGRSPDPADVVPDIDHACTPVTRLGDLWLLGGHRILCGNALDLATHQNLMRGEQAHMGFTDPPYNQKIDGNVCGLGKIKHREFAMASGEMTRTEFTAFLTTAFRHMAAMSGEGSLHYAFMDFRHSKEILHAAETVFGSPLNLCVWVKTNGGMGSLYRSRHELVWVFKNGKESHTNNVRLGKFGRSRTNVWEYAGVNSFRRGRLEELSNHPTSKPLALAADALKDVTRRGDIVLDPFGGSGTTLLAAERTGRKARLIELDPIYVDVAVKRWEVMTGRFARLAASGQSFNDLLNGAERKVRRRLNDRQADVVPVSKNRKGGAS